MPKRYQKTEPMTGADFRRLRELSGFTEGKLADLSGCTERWIRLLETFEHVGNRAALPKIEAMIAGLVDSQLETYSRPVEQVYQNSYSRFSEEFEEVETDEQVLERRIRLEEEQELRYWRMRIAEDPTYWDRTLESWDDYVNRLANTEP